MKTEDVLKKASYYGKLKKFFFILSLVLFTTYAFFLYEDAYAQTGATGNPFVDFWQRIINPTAPTGAEGAIIVTPDYVPLASAILVLIVVFIGVRFFVNARRHPNSEEPLGIIQFVIMGQGITEMFVSKYDAPVRASIIRALKANPKFTKAITEILRLREADQLFFYQAFYRDTKELLTSTVKRRAIPPMLISTAPLDEPEIAFAQSEQKFTWATLGWEYMKTCVCHNTTEKFEVELGDKKWMDVWLMAPIPNAKVISSYDRKEESEDTQVTFNVWKDMHPDTIEMNISVLPYSEELAKVASSMVQASKQVDYITGLDEHIQTQQGELQERDQLINKLRQKINSLKLLLGQKKLIGTDLPAGFYKPKDIIQWIAITIFAIIFMGYIPVMFPTLSAYPPQAFEAVGGIVAMAIYMITKKGKSQQEQDMLEEEGIDVNAING